MKPQLLGTAILLGLSLIFLAPEKPQDPIFEQALQSWEKRADPKEAKKAAELFRKAAETKKNNEDYWVRLSLAYYWLGEITPIEQKEARLWFYQEGEKAALKAIEINPESIGGNFWSVVNNGRVTELTGILSGIFNLSLCLRNMTIVSTQDPGYYYGGPDRYMGRVIYEIPSLLKRIAKFSMDDSIFFYQRSLKKEPNFFMTHLYLAESYLAKGDRDNAKKELLWVVNTSASVLPEVEPENRFYQAKAKELLEKEFGR